MESPFEAYRSKMAQAGLPAIAIDTFQHYYDELCAGATGLLHEAELEPVVDLPSLETLEGGGAAADGARSLERAVVLKLNGGLGTSMGMTRAKSLLVVKAGLTFLDVTVRQVLELRRRHHVGLPLVLMDSFRTRDDSLAALARYPELADGQAGVPLDFLQSQVPKVQERDLAPASWPADPSLEWCPPGHGDLYTSLVTSGCLASLLERGYRYAFVSNSDNLGAVLDPAVLGWFAQSGAPFAMEVADRLEADRKGGHLARLADGRLVLREVAQCPDADREDFQDVTRHRYFNTNNIWLDLEALSALLTARGGVLGLPMIRNTKHLDPTDESSPLVFQLETAMGAAISVFDGAVALRVPRSRFAPVKTTNDLLGLLSDAYVLTDDWRVVEAPERAGEPLVVDLDPRFYRLLADFEQRFPDGPPSLVACSRLDVRGDVRFGKGVVAEGVALVVNASDGQLQLEETRLGP